MTLDQSEIDEMKASLYDRQEVELVALRKALEPLERERTGCIQRLAWPDTEYVALPDDAAQVVYVTKAELEAAAAALGKAGVHRPMTPSQTQARIAELQAFVDAIPDKECDRIIGGCAELMMAHTMKVARSAFRGELKKYAITYADELAAIAKGDTP